MSKSQHDIAADLDATIREIGIPPRPAVLSAINNEMAKKEPDFNHLARLLSADVALSAALLKTVNSPFFGFDKKARSILDALLVLGLKHIMHAVAGLALKKAFRHVPDMEHYWDASARIARLSGWLVKRLEPQGIVRPEDAYTFGLFRDCGIPVLMTPFPEYRAVLDEAGAARSERFTAIEERRISLNHADIGASLAESWLLPADIVMAIRQHHAFDLIATRAEMPSVPSLIAVAHLAEHLLHRHAGTAPTCEWEKIADPAMDLLGIDAARVEVLADACREVVEADW